MCWKASCCTRWRVSMNSIAGIEPSLSRNRLPTAAWSTSFTRFCIVPTIEITRGAFASGTWIKTCRSMWKTKPSLLFAMIDSSFVSRLWASETALAQFRLRIAVGTISAW